MSSQAAIAPSIGQRKRHRDWLKTQTETQNTDKGNERQEMSTSTKHQAQGRAENKVIQLISRTEHNFREQTDAHWNACKLNEADEENYRRNEVQIQNMSSKTQQQYCMTYAHMQDIPDSKLCAWSKRPRQSISFFKELEVLPYVSLLEQDVDHVGWIIRRSCHCPLCSLQPSATFVLIALALRLPSSKCQGHKIFNVAGSCASQRETLKFTGTL